MSARALPPKFASAAALAEKPFCLITPRSGWAALNLDEVWAHRELLFFLIWRDIKIRYKQTALGALWAVIQPLFPMLIFTLFFGRLSKMPSDGTPYSIFVYAALLPWTYFASSVTNSSSSVVNSSNLISRVYFPRMIIPTAASLASLVDFVIAFVLLVGLMVWYRICPTAWSLMLLPLIALLALFSLGFGMFLAALTVKFRDFRFAVPFLVQVWMFVTPVIYPASLIPARWRFALALNPLTGIIEGFRSSLFGRAIEWGSLLYSTIFTIFVVIVSAYSFRRQESKFADLI